MPCTKKPATYKNQKDSSVEVTQNVARLLSLQKMEVVRLESVLQDGHESEKSSTMLST